LIAGAPGLPRERLELAWVGGVEVKERGGGIGSWRLVIENVVAMKRNIPAGHPVLSRAASPVQVACACGRAEDRAISVNVQER